MNRNILRLYYAATVLFVLLDFGFGINVRAAFLDNAPGLRLLFYAVLFGCFALVVWRRGLRVLRAGTDSAGQKRVVIASATASRSGAD